MDKVWKGCCALRVLPGKLVRIGTRTIKLKFKEDASPLNFHLRMERKGDFREDEDHLNRQLSQHTATWVVWNKSKVQIEDLSRSYVNCCSAFLGHPVPCQIRNDAPLYSSCIGILRLWFRAYKQNKSRYSNRSCVLQKAKQKASGQ